MRFPWFAAPARVRASSTALTIVLGSALLTGCGSGSRTVSIPATLANLPAFIGTYQGGRTPDGTATVTVTANDSTTDAFTLTLTAGDGTSGTFTGTVDNAGVMTFTGGGGTGTGIAVAGQIGRTFAGSTVASGTWMFVAGAAGGGTWTATKQS